MRMGVAKLSTGTPSRSPKSFAMRFSNPSPAEFENGRLLGSMHGRNAETFASAWAASEAARSAAAATTRALFTA